MFRPALLTLVASLALLAGCCSSSSGEPEATTVPAPENPTVPALPETPQPVPDTDPAPPAAHGIPDTPTPPPATATFTALSDAEVDAQITPRLAADESLAHAAFRGPLGPAADCAFAVVSLDTGAEARVLCRETEHSVALHSWLLDEVPAVTFLDVDADGAREAVVLATWMSGVGPEGAIPFQANVVVDWDGGQLVRLEVVEATIESLTTAAAIRDAIPPVPAPPS